MRLALKLAILSFLILKCNLQIIAQQTKTATINIQNQSINRCPKKDEIKQLQASRKKNEEIPKNPKRELVFLEDDNFADISPTQRPSDINTNDPYEVASYLEKVGYGQKLNFKDFAPKSQKLNCCAGYPVKINFIENFTNPYPTHYLDDSESGLPIPGFRKISTASLSMALWSYQSCENQTILWVNGINNNWNSIYRLIYQSTYYFPSGFYRLCFQIRNLPAKDWDSKPWGFITISQGNINVNTFFYCDQFSLRTSGCLWKKVTSNKIKLAKGMALISLTLYNGNYGDGNDLAISNITMIKLPKSNKTLDFVRVFKAVSDGTVDLRMKSREDSEDCADDVYLAAGSINTSKRLLENTPVSASSDFVIKLNYNNTYSVSVIRKCNCFEDAFWSFKFAMTPKAPRQNASIYESIRVISITNTN